MTHRQFNRKLKHIQPFLFSFALKLTNNYQNAQDLFQDAATRGYRYRDKFEMGTNFRAWMGTILRNTFINHCRAAKKRQTVDEPLDTFTHAIENRNTLYNEGEMNIRIEELQSALGQLSDLYRVPFMMHYQGYEYKEIADHLDIPMGTVKSRLNTARSMLRKIIDAGEVVRA